MSEPRSVCHLQDGAASRPGACQHRLANQAAQLVLTIIDTTEQPLALFTYPTPASAAKLYDALSYFLGKLQ